MLWNYDSREAHFIELLRFNVPTLKHLAVVCADSASSKTVMDFFIQQIGPKAAAVKGYIMGGGFTDFVVKGEGEEFLKA